MIGKRPCYCTLKHEAVDALVEETVRGRGKKAVTTTTVLNCLSASRCDKATYCRFVNPLTTRNPIELEKPAEKLAG